MNECVNVKAKNVHHQEILSMEKDFYKMRENDKSAIKSEVVSDFEK